MTTVVSLSYPAGASSVWVIVADSTGATLSTHTEKLTLSFMLPALSLAIIVRFTLP